MTQAVDMCATIFALSSGALPAGIAVVRISGPRARSAAGAIITGDLPPPRTAMLRSIVDHAAQQIIDTAIIIDFPGPATVTGEDVVELHCHGGVAVVRAVQQLLARQSGLRPAEAGEFTRRAFENGRMDLTQAEALADLLAAETELQRHQAMANMGGRLRFRAEEWRNRLVAILADIEADLDFADEADVDLLRQRFDIEALCQSIEKALATASDGERVRDGLVVAVVGPPNAGKSTLINALAGREVAIVSAVAGTTRDVLEVRLDLGGVPITLLDTAGLREAADPVEAEGVARALARAKSADLVLDFGSGIATAMPVVNGIDRSGEAPGVRGGVIYISARTGAGLAELLDWLRAWARDQVVRGEPALVTYARQAHWLGIAVEALKSAAQERDIVLQAESLRRAGHALGCLTGQFDAELVLDAIFSRFCIGK
jgi:tRNA modification GTPase